MQNLRLLKAIVERKNRLRRGADEGQTVFEYLGIIVIIAIIIAAIIASGLAGDIVGAIDVALKKITG
ncbi:hypothetical protein [Streptomyces sp. NBC_00347]|uniref:hypothetical protein n=1 Tax=Streptomyces sp. NBC_00347 TaxID=2975721 RepID=UPI002255BDFA|nr:hypothetical protein [Streptomyces sp. NBC_00347]MCX5122824.1 hypothetical protein [Streptomyces sp. NBC_00347]